MNEALSQGFFNNIEEASNSSEEKDDESTIRNSKSITDDRMSSQKNMTFQVHTNHHKKTNSTKSKH